VNGTAGGEEGEKAVGWAEAEEKACGEEERGSGYWNA